MKVYTRQCPRPDKKHYYTKQAAYTARRSTRGEPGLTDTLYVYQCGCALWCLGRDHKRRADARSKGAA